eukprot:COSAG06_NODE_24106_length_672_cov_1.879581_2_plen_24_part_01
MKRVGAGEDTALRARRHAGARDAA